MDTQASSFYGHVTLGFRIHFPYLSQPSVSKTCSFINSCIHPSPFWVFGKIFTVFTLQVYTHFFKKNPLFWSMNIFSKKSWKLFLFKSVLASQPKDIFFVLVCFCFFFFFEVFCYLNMCIFLWGIFAIYMHIQGILIPKHTYICFVRYFCYIHAYPRYLAT